MDLTRKTQPTESKVVQFEVSCSKPIFGFVSEKMHSQGVAENWLGGTVTCEIYLTR